MTKDTDSPPSKTYNSLIVDASGHANVKGDALRVELRRLRDPATGKTTYSKKLPDPVYVVGFISPKNIPVKGKPFKMSYYSYSGYPDFGKISTQEDLSEVEFEDDCYYFTTSDGEWRLKLLQDSN